MAGASTDTAPQAKLPAHPEVPPEDVTQANNELGELRRIKAEIDRRQADLEATVAALVATAQSDIQSFIERIPALESSLTAFADSYRDQLARGRGQTETITLPNGKLTWGPTRLSIDIEDEAVALADIEKRGWTPRFTESKQVIVKDKLKEDDTALKDARRIKGITVNDPEEQFQIKPAEIKLKTDTKLKTDPRQIDDAAAGQD